MNKKKLLSLALVVIMVAMLSFGTLAWFSDSDSVTNNFSVAGGENAEPDEIFSVDVLETVIDENGKQSTVGKDDDSTSDSTFTYENIAPAEKLFKQPLTKNTGSYEQWVRMKVTFDNADYWVALMAKYGYTNMTDMLYMADGTTKLTASSVWTYAPDEAYVENGQITYVFYYNDKLDVGEDAVFFSYVNIPYQFTQEDMAPFTNGDFQMIVTGEAIQVKNIDATTAQEAFATIEG